MKTTCPNCATHLELDDENLAALAGQETFECPGCHFAVRVPAAPPPPPVMAPARSAPRLLVAAPGAARTPTPLPPRPPWRPQQLTRPKQPRQPRPAASQTRRLRFRFWILGTALIVVLGGLGFILASKIKGDRYDKREQIRNEIVRNKFFQTLIASGATTEQTLQSEVAAISPDGDGFVGVSSRKLPWKEAWQLAYACGARVVDTGRTPGRNAADVTGFLAGCFSELQGETVWIAVDGLPRITDLPDLLPVSTLDRPRRLLLRWGPGTPTTPSDIERFALIPAGNFVMGDQSNPPVGDRDEVPVHTVQVSAFYMAKYEVTKEEWDAVRTWGLANGYTDLAVGNGRDASKGANHPVHSITWYDTLKWCNARSQKEGLTPCYTLSGAIYKTGSSTTSQMRIKNGELVSEIIETGSSLPECNWNANGYRLPTEAEWEKAARGWVAAKNFPWGTDMITHNQANYISREDENYNVSPTRGPHPTYRAGGGPYTSPVGSFSPNGYGLYDMAANVSEWCWDWYGSYTADPHTDPRGTSSGPGRACRGGSWSASADACRVANRSYHSPEFSYHAIGFRVVRNAAP